MPELLRFPGFETRTTNADRWALIELARAKGLEPNYIAAVMYSESGFRPNVKGRAPALGLIQFWRDFFPSVASKAGQPGARWEWLRHSSVLQQLPFVVANFTGKGLRAGSGPGDYYMANFMPAFVNKPDDFVMGEEGSDETIAGMRSGKVYEQNAGLDRNGDGVITPGDVKQHIREIVDAARGRPPLEVHLEEVDIPPLVLAGLVPRTALSSQRGQSSAGLASTSSLPRRAASGVR